MDGVTDANAALFADLYELAMLQAYFDEGLRDEAVFDLYVRELPEQRNYLLACGLDDALAYLERCSFSDDALAYLDSLGRFSPAFLDSLADFHFSGDVHAVPEGTPVFAGEPIMELVAPLPEAQLAETFLINQIQLQTMIASKGVRTVAAAAGRTLVDFGARRAHGTDAALKAARALSIAGFDATSNVFAGQAYGIAVSGTMAHSYVQAHDDELAAFRAFVASHPDTTLLVDTYDTVGGVEAVIRLARELGDNFRVRALRLDSGDLASLARSARRMLDDAGLDRVELFASGGLDEHSIAALVAAGAPIDGFGVGTRVDTSDDAPYLECVYKLVAYAGRGRIKLSSAKATLPGRKQVYRVVEGGEAVRDVIARHDEPLAGEPLMVQVMEGGCRLPAGEESLDAIRERARVEIARLPARLRALEPTQPPYPVGVSAALRASEREVREALDAR